MIKIAFFDIDGTLVSFNTHAMPESCRVALREMRKNGIKLYIASGRPLYMLQSFLRDGIGDFDGFDGFLCNSGQVCLDERGIFRMETLDPQDIAAVDKANREGLFDVVYMLSDRAVTRARGPEIRAAEKRANISFSLEPDFDPTQAAVFQLNTFLPKEKEYLIRDITNNIELVRWHPDFADGIPKGGGKDVGIQAVLDHYGLSRDEALACGDGGNDASMLAYVGMGCAMGNAVKEAMQAANMVTTAIDDDGIYRAAVHLGLIKDVLSLCKKDSTIEVLLDGERFSPLFTD